MNDKIKLFKEMIENSSNIVFFGGAGVSTESGIKDYRSKDGIYSTVREYGVSPEVILSHNFLLENPEVFYKFYYEYFLSVTAEPNNAHKTLAKLEKDGKLKAVITQNIDNLHQRAGSKNVIELHGTTREHYCISCHTPYSFDKLKTLHGKIPCCEKCGGLVRPKVTLYSEMLDSDIEYKAIKAISNADMLIVGGTSLAVYPAAAYLNYFNGKYIVLVNKTKTPFDNKADLVFRESIGTVLKEVTEG